MATHQRLNNNNERNSKHNRTPQTINERLKSYHVGLYVLLDWFFFEFNPAEEAGVGAIEFAVCLVGGMIASMEVTGKSFASNTSLWLSTVYKREQQDFSHNKMPFFCSWWTSLKKISANSKRKHCTSSLSRTHSMSSIDISLGSSAFNMVKTPSNCSNWAARSTYRQDHKVVIIQSYYRYDYAPF